MLKDWPGSGGFRPYAPGIRTGMADISPDRNMTGIYGLCKAEAKPSLFRARLVAPSEQQRTPFRRERKCHTPCHAGTTIQALPRPRPQAKGICSPPGFGLMSGVTAAGLAAGKKRPIAGGG